MAENVKYPGMLFLSVLHLFGHLNVFVCVFYRGANSSIRTPPDDCVMDPR